MTPCPICAQPIYSNPRYPRAVCSACAARAVNRQGQAVRYDNESLSGGLVITIPETGESRVVTGNNLDDALCWIDGTACAAQEEYMGSVIIQLL